ncbi:hypothetical protein [uncultured Clostridium sp.]|uniref:hypothetical protein n=1 Tax=uncultured Clostridium sp. TaxID=59620 RepID=UPI0026161E87|nr:hypothetical protein [uncultured Clostridium sp.]
MKKLYKFYWDCGRQGEVEGVFIADETELENAIGENIYFGEILGKHSEVYGVLEKEDIEEIKVSKNTLEELEKILGNSISGYNPLGYVRYECNRCGDEVSIEDCELYLDNEENIVCEYCIKDEEKNIFKKL